MDANGTRVIGWVRMFFLFMFFIHFVLLYTLRESDSVLKLILLTLLVASLGAAVDAQRPSIRLRLIGWVGLFVLGILLGSATHSKFTVFHLIMLVYFSYYPIAKVTIEKPSSPFHRGGIGVLVWEMAFILGLGYTAGVALREVILR